MQMSIEQFKRVHKMMWDAVISYGSEIKNKMELHLLKRAALLDAYSQGFINDDELSLIEQNDNCLLCASCTCDGCVLGSCKTKESLYRRALQGDVHAMKEIRDVVDKQPYTDLSFVDLH